MIKDCAEASGAGREEGCVAQRNEGGQASECYRLFI